MYEARKTNQTYVNNFAPLGHFNHASQPFNHLGFAQNNFLIMRCVVAWDFFSRNGATFNWELILAHSLNHPAQRYAHLLPPAIPVV